MFSQRNSEYAESKPKPEPSSRRCSSDSMNAQVGYNGDRKQRTESEHHHDRDGKDQRKDRRQSLNFPYIIEGDGVNPPRIMFVSPAGSDRSSGRSRANSVRTPDHGDHRGPRSSKWWKKDLEDAIQFALSKIEIRPSTSDYEDGYENDYRDYDDSKRPSGEYRPSTSRATQSRGHDAATSREPDRSEPGVGYYYRHQDPRSASEQTLHGFRMDNPEYTDVSVQTDAPGNERRDTEPDPKPKRHYSQRRSHVPPSRPSVSRVPSAEYYVGEEDTKARVADEPRSKGARDSYVYYQGPYRVLVTPNDEDGYRNKRSSKYNAYVRRQDEDDRRHEHDTKCEQESQRRHRSSRYRHSRAEHAYDEGHKERREDRDRDRQSSHREGDGARRWPFPFTKDRRSEYR